MPTVLDGNLPTPLTALVGRREELAALDGLISRARVVTILGPGGAGKTRLAIAAAEHAAERIDGGTWWVELSDVAGPDQFGEAILTACELAEAPGQQALEALAEHFGQQRALLVLDNCEHVAEECATIAQRLLSSAGGLVVLATSREPLGVSGERLFRLGGLSWEPGDAAESREAVELFLDRADAAGAELSRDAEELGMVAEICERLDGLPLALELAAARAGMLSLEEIARRLDETDVLLRQPSRTAPSRHRTLDDALDWSHDLLPAEEKRLFALLSVFSGSFSLLAVEALAAARGIDRREVLPLLSALVDKSLVQVAGRGAEHRYRLLNTVHAYAAARLAEAPEEPAVAGAHADFFVALAMQARDGLQGPEQARWLERIELEHDNLRAVLRANIDARPQVAGRLASLMWPFWYRRGHYSEARSWLEQAAGASEQMEDEVAADVLAAAGAAAFLQCEYSLAQERLSRARELYERASDRVGVAAVVQRLGSIAREQGRYEQAAEMHREAAQAWEGLGEPAGVAE